MSKVHIATPGTQRLSLRAAILIYGSDYLMGSAFATVHGIERGTHPTSGAPTIAAGVPATREACANLLRGLGSQAGFNGFLTPELLYIGANVTAWWRPPAPARVFFECVNDKAPAKHLGKVSAITPQPGLVFTLAGDAWHVFAVKGADRPTPATRLYRAPYFNVDEHGYICEGNLSRPASVSAESLARFERAFFDSRFTHTNVRSSKDITTHKGGIYALWRDLLRGQWKSFPEATLVSAGKTLAQRIRQLDKQESNDDMPF